MSYLQLDDAILDHPKFIRADRLAPSGAVHLWLGLMSYCKRHLTDGVVPLDMLGRVHGPAARWRQRALDALIEVGLIERTEHELRVHDYLQWNLGKDEIERKSADRKARRNNLERVGQQRSDVGATSERRRSDVEATSERSRVDAPPDRQVVSNDVIDLASRGRGPGRARAHKTETETETETETILEPPPSPPPLVLAPAPTNASTSSAEGRRRSKGPRARTLCPLDFKPDAKSSAKADELGFNAKLEAETREEFIDWWHGKGLLQANWQSTYRNRLRAVAKSAGLRPRKPHDAESLRWQEQRRAAMETPKNPVQLGADFEKKLGAILA